MRMSDNGLDLVKRSEGLRLHAYPDPGTGGDPWTIGYGHTAGVRPGDVCTETQATVYLLADIEWAEDLVNAKVTAAMTQGQFDALTSFAFNLGPGAPGVKDGFAVLRNGNTPTFLRKINGGDWRGAADELPKWANPPLPGLVVRRARERDLFLGRDWRLIPDANVAVARQHNAVAA